MQEVSIRQLSFRDLKTKVVNPSCVDQVLCLPKEEREILLERIEKELVPLLQAISLKNHVIFGINSVMRMLQRKSLDVVVLSKNAQSSVLSTQIQTLAIVVNVPICVIYISSEDFGALFGLKSLSVFGIQKFQPQEEMEEADELRKTTIMVEQQQRKLASICDFMIAKANQFSH